MPLYGHPVIGETAIDGLLTVEVLKAATLFASRIDPIFFKDLFQINRGRRKDSTPLSRFLAVLSPYASWDAVPLG